MSIIVRRSEPSDAKGIKEIYECTNAYTGTLQLPNPSLESWQKRISNMPDNVYSYVALIDGEIVGNLGMEVCVNPRRRHVASFGMGVKDDVLGKGVGSQLLATAIDLCDNWINIKRRSSRRVMDPNGTTFNTPYAGCSRVPVPRSSSMFSKVVAARS